MRLSQTAKIEYAVYPYKSKSVECTEYYKFRDNEAEIRMMEAEFLEKPEVIHVFPFVREGLYDDYYVEVYIWDTMMYPASYERYLIVDGYKLPEDQEEEFLDYMSEARYKDPIEGISLPLYGNPSRMRRFVEEARRAFPQWNLIDYAPHAFSNALRQCYFASHPGIRETLYKSGLCNLAERLEIIPGYNLRGLTPQSIVCNLPLKLLRIIERERLWFELLDEETIKDFKEAYRRFGGFIDYKSATKCQLLYLVNLVSPNGFFYGMQFNRTLYRRMTGVGDDYLTLYAYSEFMKLKDEFSGFKRFDVPDLDEIDDAVDMLKAIREYMKSVYLDRRIKKRKEDNNLEYTADGYRLMLPDSCEMYCKEALSQGNCLLGYIKEYAKNITNILFLRKEKEPDKSFVTVEVRNGEIHQVRGRFNCIPDRSVFIFLEKYALEKGLDYNPAMLISGDYDEDEDDDYDDYDEDYIDNSDNPDLWEYVEDYRRRTNHPTMYDIRDDRQYEQLGLADIYPELFPEMIWEKAS